MQVGLVGATGCVLKQSFYCGQSTLRQIFIVESLLARVTHLACPVQEGAVVAKELYLVVAILPQRL